MGETNRRAALIVVSCPDASAAVGGDVAVCVRCDRPVAAPHDLAAAGRRGVVACRDCASALVRAGAVSSITVVPVSSPSAPDGGYPTE